MNLKYLCFKDINRTTAPLLRQKIGVAGAWSMERGGGARRREELEVSRARELHLCTTYV